jgi:hypothetical protein
MIVKLSLLDRKEVLFYPHEVPVTCVVEGAYRIIGVCKVYRDEQGRHLGELELEEVVSLDLYFYYRAMSNTAGILNSQVLI